MAYLDDPTVDPLELAKRAAILGGLKAPTLSSSSAPVPSTMAPPGMPAPSSGLNPPILGPSNPAALNLGSAPRSPSLTAATLDPNDPKYTSLAPHGLAKFGSLLESAIGGPFTGDAQRRLQAPQIAYQRDVDAQTQAATTEKSAAETENQQAQAAAHEFEPTSISEKLENAREIAAGKNDTAETDTDKRLSSLEKIAAEKNSAAQALQSGKPITMDELAAQAEKEGDQKTVDQIKQYKSSIAAAGKGEPGSYQVVPDANGNTVGFVNPKSRTFVPVSDIPGAGAASGGGNVIPVKPTGQSLSRADQAKVVSRAGDDLISQIQQHRDKIGNIGAIINSAFLGTPLSDPVQQGLAAQIGSFAALNPAMHGFRGSQAIEEFKKLIGGIPNNPDSMIAAIKAIQRTAGAFSAPSGGNAPPPGAKVVSLDDFLKGK